jgi:hypothetical protein
MGGLNDVISSLLVVLLTGPSAIACTVSGGSSEAGRINRGEACSISISRQGVDAVGLSEAENLGGGFVWQIAYDGNACESEQHAVMIDCNAFQDSVQGIEEAGGNWFNAISELNDFANASVNDGDLSLEAFAEQGVTFSLPDAIFVELGNRIDLNGQLLGLSCSCRLFYPGSPGARN